MTSQGTRSTLYIDRYQNRSSLPEVDSTESALDFETEYSSESVPSSYLEENTPHHDLSSLENGSQALVQDQRSSLDELDEVMNMARELGETEEAGAAVGSESEVIAQAGEKSKKFLKDMEREVTSDKYLTPEQRKQAKKQIETVRQGLQEDPELPVEEELSDWIEILEVHKKKLEAVKVETGRGSGRAAAIVSQVNGELSTDANYDEGYQAGALDAINRPWGEEGGPETSLTRGNREVQALDLVMQGKTGLENSGVPGKVVEILYDTGLNPEEQIEAIQSALDLPKAARTYVLARVVNEIQKQDSAKLDFLSEYAPEVLSFLKEEINYGKGQIEQGSLAQNGTRFTGTGYERYDTDTHWYTNDWNDIQLPFSELTQGMADAVHTLEQAGTSASQVKTEENEDF